MDCLEKPGRRIMCGLVAIKFLRSLAPSLLGTLRASVIDQEGGGEFLETFLLLWAETAA